MKQVSDGVGAYYQHYPRIAVAVSAYHDGKADVMTCTWHTPLSSKPPLFGVLLTPRRFTYQLIVGSKEFAVNFLTAESARLLAAVGGSKGAAVDKFSAYNIARDIPLKTNAPVLAEAYAAYECKLVEDRPYGDHQLLVGEVVAAHWREEAFTAEGVMDVKEAVPALYLGSDLYITRLKPTLEKIDRGR